MCQDILCRLHSNYFSNSFSKMSQLIVFTSVNWRIFQKVKWQVLCVIGWELGASLGNLASPRCLKSIEQLSFIDPPVDPLPSVVILWHYLYSECNIFIFCFRCAFIYCVVCLWWCQLRHYTPHRAHRWHVEKLGCDRLVSEPTLSELNTSFCV